MKLHFIQDIPTGHNNVLLASLSKSDSLDLKLYYVKHPPKMHVQTSHLYDEIAQPTMYSGIKDGLRMFRESMLDRESAWMLVAWSNPSTKTLVLLWWITRRPYNIWFDLPDDANGRTRFRRRFAQWFLEHSRARVYCVGTEAMNYFHRRGIDESRLINLPVAVEYVTNDGFWSESGKTDSFKVTTGSRLVSEKGFDLLIEAIAIARNELGVNFEVVIVGSGPEEAKLRALIAQRNLESIVQILGWLPPEKFSELMSRSDLVVHPARMDAYGGATLLAFAAGVPVIGSAGAGSVRDLITDHENGLIYEPEDIGRLAELLVKCIRDRGFLANLRSGMRQARDSSGRSPDELSATLIDNLLV